MASQGTAAPSNPRISAASQAALESLYAENRACAARLRACHTLYEICEDEHYDQLFAAGYNPETEDRRDYAMVDAFDMASSEIVAAYGVHIHRAKALLTLARNLIECFPNVVEAMESGRLDERTAELLVKHMRTVSAVHRSAVQKAVIDWLMDAIDSGRRPGRTAILNKTDSIIEKHDPDGVLARRADALKDRHVQIRRGRDGMSVLHVKLSSVEASTIFQVLQDIARERAAGDRAARAAAGKRNGPAADTPPEERTMGQRRADALVDALLGPSSTSAAPADSPSPDGTSPDTPPGESGGRLPSQVRPQITVLAPLGPDGEPEIYLPRGGPASIDALIALLSRSVGATISVPGTTPGSADSPHRARRYRISTELARRIRLRDGTCRHPGCSVPADDCDIDHVRPFDNLDPAAGGLTVESNLMCLCRRHHRFKTFHDWNYSLAADGTLTITTDTGRTISTEPDGPLTRWRQKSSESAAPEPGPAQFPLGLLKPERTHWYKRAQRLAAERRANIVARNVHTEDHHDPDPPPF